MLRWLGRSSVCRAPTTGSCCRPGDSIRIGPGQHIVEGLSISHPLRLIGAPGCQLLCRRTAAEAALEIWSNVRVEGISMVATRAFCIRHNDGELHLSRCKLTCHSEHLSHLYSALVAAARQRQGTAADLDRPAGRLTVEETSIAGSMRAVLCQGDGELVDVRVLGSACGHCFWFQVRQDALRAQHSRAVRRKITGAGAQTGSSVRGGEEVGGDEEGGRRGHSGTRSPQFVPGARQTRLQARRRRRSSDRRQKCTEGD